MQYPTERVEPIGLTVLYQLDEVGFFNRESLRQRLSHVKDDLHEMSERILRNAGVAYVSCSIVFKRADLEAGVYEDYRDDPSILRLMLGGLNLTDPQKRREQIGLLQKNYLMAFESAPELLGTREMPIEIEILIQGCRDVVRSDL